jgi:hypothetical protein
MIDRKCGGKSMHRQTLIEVAGPSDGEAPTTEGQAQSATEDRERTDRSRDLARDGDIRAGGRCVDHERIDFGVSACISRETCQDQVTDAQWPDCPIGHHVGGPTVTNHPCVGEARSDLAVGSWSHLNHPD